MKAHIVAAALLGELGLILFDGLVKADLGTVEEVSSMGEAVGLDEDDMFDFR